MRRLIAIFICCLPLAALAQQPRVIGILGGKSVHNLHTADVVLEKFKNTPIPLYDKPNKDKPPVKEATPKDFYSAPYMQNRKGPFVYGFAPHAWHLIGYEGRGYWIETLPNIKLYSYEEMIMNRQAYLKNWEWQVFAEPAGPIINVDRDAVLAHHHSKAPAEIQETRKVKGEMWVRFKLLDSICYELDRPAHVVITGWLPAYARTNDTTFWFDTRRCP